MLKAAKDDTLQKKAKILLPFEDETIVKQYEDFPTSLPHNDYKSRYYGLIALRFVVNIYVLTSNDYAHFRMIDCHLVN